MSRFDGKIALVTGGATGLGFAVCQKLAEQGAFAVIADIDFHKAEDAAMQLQDCGAGALAVALDVSQEDSWKQAMSTIVEKAGAISILVNNAGLGVLASIEDSDFSSWRRVMSVNLDGVFLGTQIGIEAMKSTGGGAIVNMSSIRSIAGDPDSVAYDASKGGVDGLTRSAALHCAKNNYNIRINTVHPAYVMTDMVKNALAGLPNRDELIDQITAAHPLGRMGTASEIADVVAFLCSDEATFMTGSRVMVDGGFTAQ